MEVSNSSFFEAFKRAEILRTEGKLPNALEAYSSLLKYRLETVNEVTYTFNNYDALIIERAADLSILFNLPEVADYLLSGLQILFFENSNTYAYLYILLKRTDAVLKEGHLQEAFKFLKQLSPYLGDVQAIDFNNLGRWQNTCHLPGLSEEEKVIVLSRALYIMGSLLIRLGQYTDGLSSLEYGYNMVQDIDLDIAAVSQVPFKLLIARGHLEKGDIQKAQRYLSTIEEDQFIAGNLGEYIGWLEIKGKLNLLCGQFGLATESLSKIKSLCRNYKLDYTELSAGLNLANIKIYLNQVFEAEQLLDEVERRAKTLSINGFQVQIELSRQLARYRSTSQIDTISVVPTLMQSRSTRAASSPTELVIEVEESPSYQSDNYLAFFEDRASQFQIELSKGNYVKATSMLLNIQKVFDKTDSILIKARIAVLAYMLGYYSNERLITITSIQEVRLFLIEQELKAELWQLQRFLGWDTDLPTEQREVLVDSNNTLINELAGSLSVTEQTLFFLNKWTSNEEFIVKKVIDLSTLQQRLQKKSILGKSFLQIRLYLKIIQLQQLIHERKQTLANEVLGSKLIKSLLTNPYSILLGLLVHPKDRATIVFLVLPDQLLIIYRSRNLLGFLVAPITRIELRHQVTYWHQLSAKVTNVRGLGSLPKKDSEQELVTTCTELSLEIAQKIRLMEVINLLPEAVKRLTIVPDDVLTGFPFGAIPYAGSHLIERYALSTDFGNRSWKNAFDNNQRRKAYFIYISAGESGKFQALPGAETEVTTLSKLMADRFGVDDMKVVGNLDATKDAILSQLKEVCMMHIACHGIFDYERPDQTGLILLNNEKISLRDIAASSVFNGLDHITLSSCWAADHFILPGRWVISLPETLYRAGVKSILSCLWQVSDIAAVAFMKAFYNYACYFPKDIALQKAQLDALYNRLPNCPENTANIFYWSGFILFGSTTSFTRTLPRQ